MSIQFDDYRRLVESCIKRGIIKKPDTFVRESEEVIRKRRKQVQEAMQRLRQRRKAESDRILAYGQQ